MAALEKTIKLTQAQYDTLAAGGTVGSYTGLNENYIYLVEDNDGYVLYSGAQSLTTAQKTQARSNIGAGTSSFSGSYADLTNKPSAVLYTSQSLTDAQKTQARTNIGAGTSSANYYPTAVSWTNGSSSGPKATITMSGTDNITAPAIPAATSGISGVVSTTTQNFAGEKTFKSNVNVEGTLTLKGTSAIYNSVGGSTLLWTGTGQQTALIEANSLHRLYFFDGGSYTFGSGNLYAIFCTYAGTTVYIKAYDSAGGVVWSEAINSCGMVLFQYMSWGAYLWKSGSTTNIKSMTNVSSIKVECGGGNRTTVYRVHESG